MELVVVGGANATVGNFLEKMESKSAKMCIALGKINSDIVWKQEKQ